MTDRPSRYAVLLGVCSIALASACGDGGMGPADTGSSAMPDVVTPGGDSSVPTDAAMMGGDAGSEDAPAGDTSMGNPCAGGACPTVINLSSSDRNTCAVLMGGTVKCWGYNGDNVVSPGATTERTRPTEFPGLTGIAEVSLGTTHACARKTDGTVWCWGAGTNGQLGQGAMESSQTPVQVMGLTGVSRVGAGNYHSCALKTDGTVWCWGRGSSLGVGGVNSSATPVQVTTLTDVTDISVAHAGTYGSTHPNTCALKRDGSVMCWGDNDAGQLGNGTRDDARVPIAPMDLPPVAQITSGGAHTCALLRDGGVRCWGRSDLIGDGSREMRLVPTAVSGLSNVRTLIAGPRHTCALEMSGTLRCWGENGTGQTGQMWTSPGSTPTFAPTAIDGPGNVALFSLGENHTCVFTTAGSTECFGSNADGELGQGMTGERDFRRNVVRW